MERTYGPAKFRIQLGDQTAGERRCDAGDVHRRDGEPFGVVYDGLNVWVPNSVSNNVTKLRVSDGLSWGHSAWGRLHSQSPLTEPASG